MPRDGAIIFGDIEAKLSVLKVACSKCTRKGHYIVKRLIRAHGRNAKVIDWIDVITADCPKRSAGNINRGNINRGNVNAGNVNRGNVNRGNVNRGNVNRQFNNADINRNVNANGWGNHFVADDPHWGWGSFAGGAAAAATGAAVGAAVANRDNVAAAAPAAGTVVGTLPSGCSAANTDQALYSCGGVQYQPAYDGSNLVYQAVGQPQ